MKKTIQCFFSTAFIIVSLLFFWSCKKVMLDKDQDEQTKKRAVLGTDPVLTIIKPENLESDTIYIIKGQSVTFNVLGEDGDNNMRGIEWYNNDFIGSESFTPTGSRTITRTIDFNTVGTFNVSCTAFDENNTYSNGIKWKVKVLEPGRTAYVDWGDEIVGNTRAEDSLFSWAQRNSVDGFSIYLPSSFMTNNHLELNNFISRSKTKGIKEVGVVIGNGTVDLQAALTYYDDPAVTHKFDGLLTEIEYWGGGEAELTAYIQVLSDMKAASNARTPGFRVESYMGGGFTQAEANRLIAYADRILLVCYTASTDPASVYYTYRRERLQYFLNAAVNNNRFIEIRPLFSLEPNFHGGKALSVIDNSFFGGFKTDNDLANKYKKAVLNGSQYFTYFYMNPNKLYVPRQYYHIAEGYSNDTITIEQGGTVTFKTEGNDQNGNFSTAEWYLNGVLHGQESVTPTTAAILYHNITFNNAGTYTVLAKLHDATGLYTPENYLSKIVVNVSSSLVNRAKGKAATQSTTAFGAEASRAVDGNPNGSWAGASLTHTSEQDPSTQAWWQVDLGSVQNISQVKIFNRTDCCSERLSNFHVFVSDAPFTGNTVSATQAQSGVSDFAYSGALGAGGDFAVNRTGRYVRVQLTATNAPLCLAEVKVF